MPCARLHMGHGHSATPTSSELQSYKFCVVHAQRCPQDACLAPLTRHELGTAHMSGVLPLCAVCILFVYEAHAMAPLGKAKQRLCGCGCCRC